MFKVSSLVNKTTVAATICLSLSTGLALPPVAQAWDVGSAIGAVVGVGVQYAYLQKQISYIDGKGRNEHLQQLKDKVGVDEAPEANAMLDDVMNRLSTSIAQTDPSIKDKPYNYFVNKDQSFNAFCSLGHNLSVNIGLFEKLNYNEDEIAVVVGHELGHGQKNHPAQGVKRSLPIDLIASLYASQNPNAASVIGATLAEKITTAKTVTKPMEGEADELAFTYTVNAGYNVGAGAAVWERVLETVDSKSTGINELFNDHPTNVSRRNNYNKKITQWSKDQVTVNAETGMISIKNKEFCIPAAMADMSSKERAYLVAGNLAAVFHQTKNPGVNVWVNGDNNLMAGQQPIMSLNNEATPDALVARLKAAM